MGVISLELLIVISAAIVNLFLGFLVLRNNPTKATNKYFFIFTLTLASYVTVNFLALHQFTDSLTLLLIRVVMANALLVNLTFFFLVAAFPGEKLLLSKKIYYGSIIFTALLIPLSFTSLIFESVVSDTTQPVPSKGMPLFLLHTLLFLGGGTFYLIKKYKNSEGSEKSQYKFLILGVALMFAAILITNLLFVLILKTTNFVGFLPVYITVFAGIIAYAILKHELFNLRVLATQVFAVLIAIVLFAEAVIAPTTNEKLVDSLVLCVVIVFGILLVNSVKREVEQRQKLQDLTEKLKALDKQKDEFLSMAAHELRAPMTAIKGYISMVVEGDTGDIPEKARGFLADTGNITDRLIRLVNNMLNVSRIEEGRLTYQEEVDNLSSVIRAVFNQFAPEAQRKGLQYNLDIPVNVRDKVKVDPDRIQEVIGNFLSNAIKYTDSGFVKVKMLQCGDDCVRVEVIDSGSGISAKEQDKLFQKFHRVESNVGKTTGSGLGLYISKLLVEKFGGKIGVVSGVGEGSTFWFELPLVA